MPTNPADPPAPDGGEDQIIPGHKYDGIREYDNPMPGWWVWLFIATIVFSVVYALGIQVFGFVDTYEEDLAEGLAELAVMRETYAAANPDAAVDAATLAAFAEDPARVEAGAVHYAAQCAACHGDQGQGLIGPNLADAYWIHGGTDEDVYTVISEGVLEKGMPAWQGTFSPEERAEIVAFVRSLEGTTHPDAKAPEGDLAEPES
ncbi:MAG: cbb3-type cytochrome c oxidase N-terminal domain-containing protein [Rhodothermales bacterium]|nr:cbb3-type cytochrome c oxidase N-terminal domain-containing protein [Rhodothermales bacterium]